MRAGTRDEKYNDWLKLDGKIFQLKRSLIEIYKNDDHFLSDIGQPIGFHPTKNKKITSSSRDLCIICPIFARQRMKNFKRYLVIFSARLRQMF